MQRTLLAGRYRLDERLSHSPNGEVFRAVDQESGRVVALKLLKTRFITNAKFGARMRQEFKILSSLCHDNLVKVYDAGQASEREHYLAMEFLAGVTLAKEVERRGSIAANKFAPLVCDIAGALDAVHARGILHRDVNAGNVMVVRDDAGNQKAKLLDFGLAKIGEQDRRESELNATGAGVILGHVGTMSPEQARAGTLTAASDVYSFAAATYMALTGREPFASDSEIETLLAHVNKPVPPMIVRPGGVPVPPAVEAVVRRGLSKQPNQRQTSAGEFARDFCRAANVPIPASLLAPLPTFDDEPAAVQVPSTKTLLALSAALAATIAVGTALGWFLLHFLS